MIKGFTNSHPESIDFSPISFSKKQIKVIKFDEKNAEFMKPLIMTISS
jgi:hypothetical protein